MIIELPHIGLRNVDHITSVEAYAARRHRIGVAPHVRRLWFLWGRPIRIRDPWSFVASAHVEVIFASGASETFYCRPGEPARWRDEILAVIAAARDVGVERIVAAAIRRLEMDRAWMTYTQPSPARHHHILHSMPPDANGYTLDVEQGFLTSTGRYVGRREAMGIAVAAGQVSPSKVRSPSLFSEDLW